MRLVSTVIIGVVILNTLFAYSIVFGEEKRETLSIWSWLLVLTFFPGIGIIAFIFLGRKLSTVSIFDSQILIETGVPKLIEHQKQIFNSNNSALPQKINHETPIDLVNLFLESNQSPLEEGNHLSIISDGEDKVNQLIDDINKSKHHIHMIYFIFRMDEVGRKVLRALEDRAEKGVKVKILYEPSGARAMSKGFFNRLHSLGGIARPFFGANHMPINFRTNFRMHRKIAVLDGKVAFTGGFNIGNDYLGLYENMGYWRDTHLRIEGNAVRALQNRFIMDWNAAVSDYSIHYSESYYPECSKKGKSAVQIVSSGPDDAFQSIKKGFIKMISMAKESILIQTPYFIPDEGTMEAIKIALMSGVNVKIMIPNKPDHPLIYRATLSYVSELIDLGAQILVYNKGFLHSKTIVIDKELLSIGTANFDIRSFRLNFEITAFIYDRQLALEQVKLFENDSGQSYLLTKEMVKTIGKKEKMRRQFSRLFSPIL